MENQKLMGMVVNAPVQPPFGPRHSDPSRKCLERACSVGPESGLRLPPGPPAGSRRQPDAEIADLAFATDRKVRIGEAEIRDETADRGTQPEHKRADPDAQSGSAEPLAQLSRRQVTDPHEVDGAISPRLSSSRTRR